MEKAGVYENDSQIISITAVKRHPFPGGCCIVILQEANGENMPLITGSYCVSCAGTGLDLDTSALCPACCGTGLTDIEIMKPEEEGEDNAGYDMER